MKTIKAYAKRLKITKNGKILSRKTGQDHFNSKEGRRSQLAKKKYGSYTMSNKAKATFLR